MFETEWSPATAQELSRLVADNAVGERRPLAPVGGRTALHYGGSVPRSATAVSLAELHQIIDYPARDMTITVGAGLRWETLQKTLAAEGQRLPIDVPQAHRATVGGAIATNASGPSRFGHGTFRDYVIGISAVDGTGRLFSAGGRVVKNVAGYDLCKLLTGSLGALAIITQITLKLRPMPETRSLVWNTFSSTNRLDQSLEALNTSKTRPVIIDVLNEKSAKQFAKEARRTLPATGWNVCICFEGTEREVDWQMQALRDELRPFQPQDSTALLGKEADALLGALTEYQAFSDDPLTFQATMPPSVTIEFVDRASRENIAVQAHVGNGIVIGHLPDSCSQASRAVEILGPLRLFAESHGGALVILNCEEDWKKTIDVFGTRPSAWMWMHRLKSQLDPHGVLNPGRLPA